MIGSDGRQARASVVASTMPRTRTDQRARRRPGGTVRRRRDVERGSADMTLSLRPADRRHHVVALRGGTVSGIGTDDRQRVGQGHAGHHLGSATAVNQEPGDPLLNQQGAVIGILYQVGRLVDLPPHPTRPRRGRRSPLDRTASCTAGSGCEGSTASGSGGAAVDRLMAGSPANGLLQPGDVVVALGWVPIRSMADLRGRFYVMAPKTTMGLSVAGGRLHPHRGRDPGRLPLAC